MSPYEKWERYHLDDGSIQKMSELYRQDNPTLGGGDTESTGLHIIYDKAFLIVFGWFIPGKDYGRVFTFEPTDITMTHFFEVSKKLKWNVWHNTKFDLHMMENLGYKYRVNNLIENMALARASFQAIPAREGGNSLALKDIGKLFVDAGAADAENRIKEIKQELREEKTKVLAAALKQFPMVIDGEVQTTSTGRPRNWGKGAIEKFLKDITNSLEDLPEDVRQIWEDWHEEYGGDEVSYKDIYDRYKEEMIRYAQDDVITMLEFAKKTVPIIKNRQQMSVIKREQQVIYPLFRMERVGMKIDRERLEQARKDVKNYIIERRKYMYNLIGKVVNANQHQEIKNTFKELWGIRLENSDKAALKAIEKEYKGQKPAEYAEVIRELRRLEKWYSTYILRILKISEPDGRFYTQIQQCNAVSGRVGSDGQQFPKKALKTHDGRTLFHPREVFIPDGGEFDRIYYLDYSQIELRNQAHYTILVSGGDKNLCRAYIPFECKNKLPYHGEKYNFKDKEKRKEWKMKGWIDEEGNEWTPTDVHGQTSHNALELLGYECYEKYKSYEFKGEGKAFFGEKIDEKKFQEVRDKGKTFNFMKNYGGGLGAAMKQLDLEEDVAQALIDGYAQAFPEVITYQNSVVEAHRKRGYVANAYGRRYYLKDSEKAYKLANYVIQGSCADLLKETIIKIDYYLKDKKSKFQMNIHDELSFLIHKDERWIVPELKKIMEDHDWHLIPIVCDIEYTDTNWAEKKEVK